MLREEKRTTVSQPVNQVTIQSMRIAIPETNRGELGKHIGWTHSIHGSGNLWQSFVSPHDANFRMCSNLAFLLLFMCNVLLSSCVVVLLAAIRRQRGDCIPRQSIDACAAFVRPVAAVRLPRQSIDAVQRLFTNYFASAGPRPNEKIR